MTKIIVAGIGTDVGKTVVSAILTTIFDGDYWKPIQCGEERKSDTSIMKTLIDPSKHLIHPPAYSLSSPISPHHAARLENKKIVSKDIIAPKTIRPLIIEGVGGVFTPITSHESCLELFCQWGGIWVIVSKNYLGSINHTLLTIDALKRQGVRIGGVIFNGTPNKDSEEAILSISKTHCLGNLLPEPSITKSTIQKYKTKWKQSLWPLLH